MWAGVRFTHPVTGRQHEAGLIRWLPADNARKALDMPWVTWECERRPSLQHYLGCERPAQSCGHGIRHWQAGSRRRFEGGQPVARLFL